MRIRTPLLLTTTLIVLGTTRASEAQSLFTRALDRFDTNKDGNISRAEIPEGAYRNMFDRMVEQYKLDPAKTYTREELEKELNKSSSTSATSTSSSSVSLSGRGTSRSSSVGSSSRTSTPRFNGRPYRPIVDLPSEYRDYDKDGDGQVGLYEWPRSRIADFAKLDKNDDGFITINELRKPGESTSKGNETEKAAPAKSSENESSDDGATTGD